MLIVVAALSVLFVADVELSADVLSDNQGWRDCFWGNLQF